MSLVPFERQPGICVAIGNRYTEVAECRMVVPNLNTDQVYRLGKLQCWTLAPAWHAA